ncbi:hypothetical protein E2320_011219 [Naja naja]|nr:hypothetical protein E2320_011219 [Naja naja]
MKGRSQHAMLFQAWEVQPTPVLVVKEEEEEVALLAAAIEAEAADSPSWSSPSGTPAARGFIGSMLGTVPIQQLHGDVHLPGSTIMGSTPGQYTALPANWARQNTGSHCGYVQFLLVVPW